MVNLCVVYLTLLILKLDTILMQKAACTFINSNAGCFYSGLNLD